MTTSAPAKSHATAGRPPEKCESRVVFDHRQNGGVVLDHGFVQSLHENVGRRVSDTVFVIAPAASVAFLEDYLDLDETRYYILRIPYSIINELHARPFEAIQQPLREPDVNRTVDSVGFDFMKQPRVRSRYTVVGTPDAEKLRIEIEEFKSEALARGVAVKGNRETLSAVLVDTDYVTNDGEAAPTPFVLDHVFYAEQLEASGWAFEIDRKVAGEQLMFVYLDVYGNEYTEVKSGMDFASARVAKTTAGQKTAAKTTAKTAAKATAAKKTAAKTTVKTTAAKKTAAKTTVAKKTTANTTTASKTRAVGAGASAIGVDGKGGA